VSSRPPRIVACLIVRDEAERLPACLASLGGQLEGVLVHDTGSTDDTPEVAAALGATVVRGTWPDDFAAARNAALEEAVRRTAPDWVLSIDADEVLDGSLADLPWLQADDVDAASIAITNTRAEAGWSHRAVRLFRPDRAVWQGRVHETVVSRRGAPLRVVEADQAVLRLVHAGYARPEAEQEKGARNAALAAAELAQPDLPPQRRARLQLDLGRSQLSAGRMQEALDAFVAARDEATPGDRTWQSATDFLARVLLTAGEYQLATGVSADLRSTGHAGYCDWLDAQALVHLGEPKRALSLLADLDEVVDPEGRRFDPGMLHETRALAAVLAGEPTRAADDLVVAMGRYGRISGRGPLAQDLWLQAGRPPADLLTELRREAGGRADLLDALDAELGSQEARA